MSDTTQQAQDLVEEATLDFTCGDNTQALDKLSQAIAIDADNFGAWHACTEIYYSEKEWEKAREAAEKAQAINPEDIHIHTSLSRIWLALGDKDKAEHWGAEARRLSWKEQLTQSPDSGETTIE